MTRRPRSEGNWLQRRYHAWAQRHYDRMAPDQAAEVERMDRWLNSRDAIWLWAGLGFALVASVMGLVRDGGLPLGLAIVSAVVVWVGVPLAALSAWMKPHKFSTRRLLRNAMAIGALSYAGAFVGFLALRYLEYGGLETDTLGQALWRAGKASLPTLVVTLGAVMFLLWGVAQVRSAQDRRALAHETLLRERDTAARHAAEARLKLLQAQIQPHFIFNTLAALQHWVDSGDARAGPLLRTLTTFLRRSTELLGNDSTTLGAEFDCVKQYLQIMQARLGERLQLRLQLAPECAAHTLPPGLLLTLVENAVEHGIAPVLAGGTVEVEIGCDAGGTTVRVRDDGAGLPSDWHDGTGLANCRERLRHHGDGSGTLELRPLSPGTEAVLHLPHAGA